MIQCPTFDGRRLWGSLMALAENGATPAGSVRRMALYKVDKHAQPCCALVRWCADATCAVCVDSRAVEASHP